MKGLLTAAIIICSIIIINELGYTSETSLAWVIIGLVASVVLVAIAQIISKKK